MQLSYVGAPCASFLFQHFFSIVLPLDVAFVQLVLIIANANTTLKTTSLSMEQQKSNHFVHI